MRRTMKEHKFRVTGVATVKYQRIVQATSPEEAAYAAELIDLDDWDFLDSDFEITEREFEIISLVAKGMKQREIAHDLAISEATVKRHLSNVFEKLQVNSSMEMLLKLKR